MQEEEITIASARSLTVTFEANLCCTESESDAVQLFSKPGMKKEDALCDPLFGPPRTSTKPAVESQNSDSASAEETTSSSSAEGNWPIEPIKVAGSSVYVTFCSGSFGR